MSADPAGNTGAPPPAVSAREVLAALAQVKRRGHWPLLQELERREPELTHHLLEELSLVHKTLLDSAAPPKIVRRLQRQIQGLILICVLSLRPSAAGDGVAAEPQTDA